VAFDPFGGHWSLKSVSIGDNMTQIELSEKGFPITLSTKSHSKVSFGEKTEIDAKEALVYLGDNRFKITFVPSDKKVLRTCNKHQTAWLKKEFNVKGDIDKVLKKMFPESSIKKVMKPVLKEKKTAEEKPKVSKEPKKETMG
tara:strand:- start:80 stop:505 length:426 start_codon:yes stop_codon:yes gene_type:complete